MNNIKVWTEAIFEPDDIVELRLLKKTTGKPIVKKQWLPAKDLPGKYQQLRAFNEQGFDIYAGPNPRTATGKSGDSNVKLARCMFCDFDNVPPGDGCGPEEFISIEIFEAGLPEPDLYVNSGNGVHVYWRLEQPLYDLVYWSDLQQRVNDRLGADLSIKNPERIMRCPGFYNLKSPRKESYIIWHAK